MLILDGHEQKTCPSPKKIRKWFSVAQVPEISREKCECFISQIFYNQIKNVHHVSKNFGTKPNTRFWSQGGRLNYTNLFCTATKCSRLFIKWSDIRERTPSCWSSSSCCPSPSASAKPCRGVPPNRHARPWPPSMPGLQAPRIRKRLFPSPSFQTMTLLDPLKSW